MFIEYCRETMTIGSRDPLSRRRLYAIKDSRHCCDGTDHGIMAG